MLNERRKKSKQKSPATRSVVYADFAAFTPPAKEVLEVMREAQSRFLGNPSSIHTYGRDARSAIEAARAEIALELQVKSDELLFTSGGTESNNIAIFGVSGAARTDTPHIITTRIEHSSVLAPIRAIEKEGGEVTYLSVDTGGRIDLSELRRAIRKETVLVSIAHANGELGTIENIRAIGKTLDPYREQQPIYFHSDASQAAHFLRILPNDLSVDLLTADGSKMYGPSSSGLLFVRRGTPLRPRLFGGGQERGLRPGTENVSAILGLRQAVALSSKGRVRDGERLQKLRDWLKAELIKNIPGILFNGERGEILPHMLNVCIPGIDAEFASVKIDSYGVALSSASACRSIGGGDGSSYVIEEIPERKGCGMSSLRVSLGRSTTKNETIAIRDAIIRASRM